jgi:hypothetical protein
MIRPSYRGGNIRSLVSLNFTVFLATRKEFFQNVPWAPLFQNVPWGPLFQNQPKNLVDEEEEV